MLEEQKDLSVHKKNLIFPITCFPGMIDMLPKSSKEEGGGRAGYVLGKVNLQECQRLELRTVEERENGLQ